MFPGPAIRIEVPGEPKGMQRAKARAITSRKDGRTFAQVYTPAASRSEAGVIRMYAEKAMEGRPPFENCLELRMTLFVGIPKSMTKRRRQMALSTPPVIRPSKKPDADNASKFIDALKSVVFRDDAQFTEWHVYKRYSLRPRVVIEIREVSLP
jgi:Holliday junction resolvase RusA-like endonuclease